MVDNDARSVVNTESAKYQATFKSLPPNLRPIYYDLVTDYATYTTKAFGRGYVAYSVLTELVRDGWRPSAKDP